MTKNQGHSWFALNTRLRYEEFVATQLSGKGYETFLPVYRCPRRWSDRIKYVEVPLFPGYLFSRINPMDRLPVLTTPGMIQIVGFGKTPIPVEDSEISALQAASRADLGRQPWPYLQAGQRVRVEFGPLRGVEGVLLNLKGKHRLILSVTVLQRSVAVEVDSAWVVSAGKLDISSLPAAGSAA